MTDREKLVEVLKKFPLCYATADEMADYLIANGVTVVAEPVQHGRWKDNGLGFMMLYTCTHCGKQALFQARPYPFCPKCGAKMDAQEAEE